MPLVFTYSDPGGIEEPATSVSLSSNSVRFGTLQLAEAADVGEAATSGLEVDDPDATWNFVGLRQLLVRETSAPSNNQIVLSGIVQDRKVSRDDSMLTGAARRWSIDLVDYNFHLGKRVFTDADAKRPAETAGDRLRWLLSSAAGISWSMYDLGNVTYPSTSLDANDYRGQRPLDLLADCAVEGNYNFWLGYNEAAGLPELYFLLPTSSNYASAARISNDLADLDDATFQPDQDATLTRSPARIAFGVYLAYAKGAVYVRNQTTGAQFAKVDQTAPMSNVKTETRARRIANKFLADHDEEEDKVTCSIWVPAASVNAIRAGHKIAAKFTHFPGWEAFRPCRVLRRTVAQDPITGAYIGTDNTDAEYRIDLELVPAGAPLSCALAISAADVSSVAGLETAPSPSVSTSASGDGIAVAVLRAENGNTPPPTNMAAAAGYTQGTLQEEHFIGYKSVSGGDTATCSSSFTPGFASGGVWVAAQTILQATSVVQDKYAGPAKTVAFDSTPATGSTIIMIGITRSTSLHNTKMAPGGVAGPVTGWTELEYIETESGTNNWIAVGIWARCMAEGDGSEFGFANGHPLYGNNFIYVIELA